MSDESGDRISFFGLRLEKHVFYIIVALGALGLVYILGRGCSCVYSRIKRPMQKAERKRVAQDKLQKVKGLMVQLEAAVSKNANAVPTLLGEAERELGKAQIRYPSVADQQDYKDIAARLAEIKTKVRAAEEKVKAGEKKKGAPK